MQERFKHIQLVNDDIKKLQEEIPIHDAKNQVDESTLVNGRRLTNDRVFRSYLVAHLRQYPTIHKEVTFLNRQAFTKGKWVAN